MFMEIKMNNLFFKIFDKKSSKQSALI